MVRKGLWLVLGCLLAAGQVHAGTEAAVRRQVQGSMLVTGTLSVDATGAVVAHTIDQPDKLPLPVVQLVEQGLPSFHFEPALRDGRPSAVQARMSLQVLVDQVDPEHLQLRLGSMYFAQDDQPAGDRASVARSVHVRYPDEALHAQVGGIVYVMVRFDHAGKVLNADVQQVNLYFVDSDPKMRHWREVFAKPALAAVRRFTFHPPATGPHADDATFTGILPVKFRIQGAPTPPYGQWDMYVPGPRQEIAWLHDEDSRDASHGEAVPDGEFAMTGNGLRLLEPPGG